MDIKYAYLIGSLFFLVIWLVLFIFKPKLRKEMLIISIVFLPAVPILEYLHIRDYWMPDYIWGSFVGIEDFIFAFSFAGIAAVIYDVLPGKKRKELKEQEQNIKKNWLVMIVFFSAVIFTIFAFFHFMLAVNTVTALIFSFLMAGLYIIMTRRDLLRKALLSGVLMSIIFFLFYMVFFLRLYPDIVERWWNLAELSGNLIFGLPVEEVAWAFAFGLLFGPLYEFFRNYHWQKK